MKTNYTLLLGAWLASTAACVSALADPVTPSAQSGNVNMNDLYNLPVEKLVGLDYTVTSADKHEEKLLDTAAAVYVVSEEDIRRSGATSIPQVLRGVPGLSVAQVNAHEWAVSARGFNSPFSNKLLVMIDGRSIYTPAFSGVFWDEQNIPLENIKRIEVIRGPGATLWGANAVNGVINIITKNADEVQGNLVSGGTSTIDTGFGTVRHGGKFSDDGFYSVYANTTDDVDKENVKGSGSQDYNWHMSHAGFRTDWGSKSADNFTVEGDLFDGDEHDEVQTPFESSVYPKGGNIMGKWTHDFAPDSKLQVQTYIDTDDRVYNALTMDNTTYDLDVQHTYTGFDRQEIVWGGGARFIESRYGMGADNFPLGYSFEPQDKLLHNYNGFLQDQIALIPSTWFLTLGSKFEDNSYTGVEIQPSARTLWKLDNTQSLWAAATRAVRTPSYIEDYATIKENIIPASMFFPLVTNIDAFGNKNLESEQLFAYEVGYRKEFGKTASADLSAFYNVYGNLVSGQEGTPFLSNGTLVVPIELANETHAKTYGVEFAPSWQVTNYWTLKGSYSFFMLTQESNGDSGPELSITTSPRHQFDITSYLNLPHSVEFDTTLLYTGGLPNLSIATQPPIGNPAYLSLNLHLGWKPFETDQLDLSLAGENLFDHQHTEFGSVEIPQDLIAKATVKF